MRIPFTKTTLEILWDWGIISLVGWLELTMAALAGAVLYAVLGTPLAAQAQYDLSRPATYSELWSLERRMATVESSVNVLTAHDAAHEAVLTELLWTNRTILAGIVTLLLGAGFKLVSGKKG